MKTSILTINYLKFLRKRKSPVLLKVRCFTTLPPSYNAESSLWATWAMGPVIVKVKVMVNGMMKTTAGIKRIGIECSLKKSLRETWR